MTKAQTSVAQSPHINLTDLNVASYPLQTLYSCIFLHQDLSSSTEIGLGMLTQATGSLLASLASV